MNRSNRKRIVIVGGVAGGASAAARARRVNEAAEITLIEKGPDVSFANCGLPYHLGGEISQRSKLLVATPDLFRKRFRINVLTRHEVTNLDGIANSVSGIDHATGQEFKLPYDKLILATGSEPLAPPFMNPQAENLFQLSTLADMDQLIDYLHRQQCSRAIVVGAGFVGLEVVEQLHRIGVAPTVVERLPQVLGPLDKEMAKLVELEMVAKGVRVHLSAAVERLERNEKLVTGVTLAGGVSIPTDLVIVGAGVRPRTELAVQAGCQLGATGGVMVDRFMRTSVPNVYAVGDICEYRHGVTEKEQRVPLAGPANRSGRIAGAHAAAESASEMGPVLGTSIVRVFSLTAASTGLNERTCAANNIACRTATIQAGSHASYFPGSHTLTLKLIYRNDGRILGAQAVGGDGADKRIDVLATAIHFGATVGQLAQLDLAYAPPFGSAKDPVHMGAFVAENDLLGRPTLAVSNLDLHDYQVVDVRSPAEVSQLPLPGSVHIPIDELHDRWHELNPTQPTITVCHSGKRAHVAACLLLGKGFQQVQNLNGGMAIRSLCN